jgi:hypothetical protein
MPPVIAVVAAFVATYATAIVVASVVLSAGVAIYGSAQARRAERDAKNQALAAMKDRMVTRIATESPHRHIYGRAKVGADIVAMFTTGDRDQFKHLVCVHAAHECDAIEEVWVNNALVEQLDLAGDPTAGRFAVTPDSEILEEQVVGPTFYLSRTPRAGSIWVFSGIGAGMQPVAITATNGRQITVAQSGPLTVSYEVPLRRKMNDGVTDPNEQLSNVLNPVVRVRKHLGTPNDPVDANLHAALGDRWPETAVLRGLCYTIITLDLNHPEFQSGIPPIHAVIRGKKLYDPRDGQTRWSQNPALVIRDYLTGPLCGVPAADLPAAQFITAANVCDEASPTGGARYTLNGTVTSDQGQASVLESMTQAMAGGLVATTWDVYAGKYVAPVAALLQSDIVGGLSVTPGVSDASIYNGVKGQYIGPENKYVQTDFKPYQNSVYRENDGRDLYNNLDFPFTDSLQRVTNLARIFTEDQRNGFTIRAEFSLKAWPLKVGQRITFTSAVLGHNAKVFRITDKSYSPTSAVQLTLKEDAASIWDYADATVVDSTPNTDLPDPWKIDAPASLSCTSGEAALLRQADGATVPRILVSWPAMAQPNGVQVEVEWRAIQSTTWERTTVSASETRAYLSPITPGFFYVVRARTVNPSLNIHSNAVAAVYQVEVFTATPTVYMYAANKPATPAGLASYSWPTGTFGAAPAGWSLTIPAAPGSGNVILWAATVAVSDVSDVSSSFNWAQAEVKNIGYSPSAAGMGPAGYSNARVFAYQRKATAPTGTPGAVDYDFASGTITTATLLNGWQKTIPASDGNPLYVTSASASAAGGTDAIASGEWSGAVVLAYDGGAGTPGMNSASVTLYQRNNTGTTPALPSAAATYTFSPPGISGLTNGWTAAMPTASAGKFLFATTATAASTSGTDAIGAGEWAPAQILAQDGGNGVDGIKTAVVYAYQRSAGAPPGTPGAVTYDFTTSAITTAALANGWQKTIPAANGNPLYVTAATASGTGATDSITGTEWSGAVVLVADGNAGAPGLNNATVTLYQRTASATSPAKPTGSMIYTFSDGTLGGLNGGWVNFIPTTGGQYLHTTFATAISNGATDTIAASEWATVQLMYDAADLIAAKTAADAANAAIATISSDSILSKGEKPEVIQKWEVINAEWGPVATQAGGLGVDATAINDAGNALAVYLGSLGANSEWRNLVTDTPISGSVFRQKFHDYYTAKQSLLNAIAAKIQSNAGDAKTVADAATAVLDKIAADNWLTKGEKPELILKWNAINGEWGALVNHANSLGVSWTALNDAGNALSTYLGSLGANSEWSNLSTDTPIVGATFRSKFYDYYTAKQTLINAIAAKTATTSTWAGTSGAGKPADNATVGAPPGTNVGNTPATTVEANANNAVKAPTFTLTGTFGGTTSNPSTSLQTLSRALSATVSGNVNPITITWEATNVDATVAIRMTSNTGPNVTVSASASNIGITIAIKCTATDDVTGQSLVKTGLVNLRFGNV